MSEPFSEEVYRNALITLSQFGFLGNKEYLKEDLYENVIEISLYMNEDKEPIKYSELRNLLRVGLWRINLPIKIIEDACNVLRRKGSIIIKDNLVMLNYDRRKEIDGEVLKSKDDRKNIEELFINFIVKEYRDIAKAPLFVEYEGICRDIFWKYLSKLIIIQVNKISNILTSNEYIDKSSSREELFDGLSSDITDNFLRAAFQKGFFSFIESKNKIFLDFIYNSYQILICWKILNIDPSVKIFEEKELTNKIIILDTNCLMGLLCISSYDHSAIKELIELSQKIGVKFFVTNKTLNEYNKVLDKSNERMVLLNVPDRILKRINDEFISSYAFEKDVNLNLTWNEYYKKTYNPIDFLKTVYNIKVVDISNYKLIEGPIYSKVINEVSLQWEAYRNTKKEYEIAEHDAFHLLLIKYLRDDDKKQSLLGPNYWFLTRDSTLYFVNDFINSLNIYKSKLSSSIKEYLWLNFITPFLNIEDRKDEAYITFSNLLKSEFITVPRGINVQILSDIQGEWIRYKWLNVDDIEEILKDTVIQTLTSKLSISEDASETRTLIAELKQHFDTLVTQKFNEKMKEISQQLEKNDDHIKDLQKNIEKKDIEILEKEKIKRFWQSISGIIGVVLLVCCLYIYLTNPLPSTQTTIITCILIISAVICILMAIAYEQVKAHLSIGARQGS